MAHTTFPVEVMTPEGSVFEGEVEMVSTRTNVGTIGIRANHEPIMAMLDPTELRLYKSETEIERFAQGEGYLQMAENRALLLVEEAIPQAELNESELEGQLSEAQARFAAAEDGTAEHERAARDVNRAEKFLAVARGETA